MLLHFLSGVLISSHTFQLSMVDTLSGGNGQSATNHVAVAFSHEKELVRTPPLVWEERIAKDWDSHQKPKNATLRNVHHQVIQSVSLYVHM